MPVQTLKSELALLGGEPVCSAPIEPPLWPPLYEATADKLRELYLSRQWSFDCPVEQQFAQSFAQHHSAKHGIFMANGTVTLHTALAALGIGPGDEVIVPALTWMATAMAVHYVGATPVFVDVQPTTLCIDPIKVEQAITAQTKAIIPVHIYGSMADMEAMIGLAKKYDLKVIEDCAHMQGGKWDGKGVGSIGDVGSFSFQQSKTMASGEGGICITNDDDLAERIFRIKHIGYAKGKKQGEAGDRPPEGLICHNFRATGFQALILQDQLPELEERLIRYNKTRDIIENEISQVPGFRIQSRGRKASLQGYYALVLIADQRELADVPRQTIIEALAAEGLQVGGTYGPVYQHKLYSMPDSSYRLPAEGCPIAENLVTDRAFVVQHHRLDVDEQTARTMGRIFTKVAANTKALSESASRKAR